MFEPNYYKWLKNKSKIENFDKLPFHIKKTIHNIEQELTDTKEVNLVKISIESDDTFELIFDWVGYEKEMEIIAESTNTTQDKIPDFIIAGEFDYMQATVGEYFYPPDFPYHLGYKVLVRTDKNLLYSI